MSIPLFVDGETELDAVTLNRLVDAGNNSSFGIANVLDYDADRAGTSDSTTAFLNAIASGKPMIYAPWGVYLLDPDEIELPSYVTLFGDGYDTELKQAPGTSGTLIGTAATSNASPAIGITIRDIRINGNKSNQTLQSQFGIGLHYTRKATLRGVYVHDTVRTAIYIAGSKARVVDCDVWDIGLAGGSIVGMAGIVGDHNASASDAPFDWIVAHNRIDGVLEHGIKLYQGCDRSVIHGNVINDTGWTGIHPWEGDDVVVSANTITDTYHHGILIWGDGSTNRGAIVTGNTVADSESQMGIIVEGMVDVTVSANQVRGGFRSGIRIEDDVDGFAVTGNVVTESGKDTESANCGFNVSGTNGTVSNNVAKNNGLNTAGTGSNGIRVSVASTTDIIVSGNRCYDNQGTKTQEYGIRVMDGADYITLIGNNCRGNDTSGYELSGAGANLVNEHNV